MAEDYKSSPGVVRMGALYEHPGTILLEELGVRRILKAEAADRLGVRPMELHKVLLGDAPMNTQLALKLEQQGFGSAEYWLVLQMQHDLYEARKKGN